MNLDRALTYSQRSLKLEPESAAFLDTLGWIFFRQGNFQAARTELLRAHALMGNDPTITEHLGDAHLALGQTEKAVAAWSQAFLADPANDSLAAKLKHHGADMDALRRQVNARTETPPPESSVP